MTWAAKRKLFYIFVLIAFFAILALLILYPRFNQAPTCFDNKQNGTETGIDCGGSCQSACSQDQEPISVLWSRSFRVLPGRYNAVAYLENKNVNTAVYKIKYRFRFADKDDVYIGMREGETYIPPAGKFAIFEPAVDIGNSIPVYTTFQFTEPPQWITIPKEKINETKLTVRDITLEREDTNPKLHAVLENDSLFTVPDINVVTILYNQDGEAVSASRTYVESLHGKESADLNFTWPEPFSEPVVAKEIIPMFNIFSLKLN